MVRFQPANDLCFSLSAGFNAQIVFAIVLHRALPAVYGCALCRDLYTGGQTGINKAVRQFPGGIFIIYAGKNDTNVVLHAAHTTHDRRGGKRVAFTLLQFILICI